jgi:hypothetical protein
MTGWTLKAAKVVAMAGLLIAGVGVSAALADPGNGNGNGPSTTVPGSPGDDCSHGNTGKDCRPDPNENGKDCEDHGYAKGNEDHCDQADTTTTTETTPTTETTTTSETTTTTPGTTTNPGSSGTPGSPASSGGSEPAAVSAPPVSTPELQQAPAQQVKGAQASVAPASNKPGELPFTGFPAWALALIGATMLAAGLGLRRVAPRVTS